MNARPRGAPHSHLGCVVVRCKVSASALSTTAALRWHALRWWLVAVYAPAPIDEVGVGSLPSSVAVLWDVRCQPSGELDHHLGSGTSSVTELLRMLSGTSTSVSPEEKPSLSHKATSSSHSASVSTLGTRNAPSTPSIGSGFEGEFS